MRADVVKMYKDVHTWVGILTGLALFIAFYAGAITMFETPLKRWATPPVDVGAVTPLEDTDALVAATIAAAPEAAKGYTFYVKTGPEMPARMSWTVWPEGRGHDAPHFTYFSTLDAKGEVTIVEDHTSEVGQFVDVIHQQVGLPFDHEISMLIMGTVAVLYVVALVSGTIVLLPSLVKDMFAVRLDKNRKRKWLDLHNILGLFSLPFHFIIAVTSVAFAFHDQIYDVQNEVSYDGKLRQMFAEGSAPGFVPVEPEAVFLSFEGLLTRVSEQMPDYDVDAVQYSYAPGGMVQALVWGERPGYIHSRPETGLLAINPYTGDVQSTNYMPGFQGAYTSVVSSFFSLHFGNFGGAPIRWAYVALGLSGAFIFYTGNVLWIETRRKKKSRKAVDEVDQPRKTKVIGALTVGITFGCIAGLSATIAAAKILPTFLGADLKGAVASAHSWIYYSIFLAAIGWAFLRGAAKGAVELQYLSIAAMLAIPLVSVLSFIVPSFGWNHGGMSVWVDVTALGGAFALWITLLKTQRRIHAAPTDSIWYVPKGAEVAA